MNVDKETIPKWLSISLEDNPKFIKELRKNADAQGYNDGLEKDDSKSLLICPDNSFFETSEYYFDSSENELHISGEIYCGEYKAHLNLDIPLSDTVLIDILEHSVKKLNKLKTALETLK